MPTRQSEMAFRAQLTNLREDDDDKVQSAEMGAGQKVGRGDWISQD